MKGSCSYTLSTNQIMKAMMLRSRRVLILLPLLLTLAGLGWAVWQSGQGLSDRDRLVDTLMATAMGDLILIFFMFGILQIRANRARSLPAGRTMLDWSPSGLAVRAEQEMVTFRWEDVRWKISKDAILLGFPGGRFTLVTSREVSDADRASLREALNASGRWSRELRGF